MSEEVDNIEVDADSTDWRTGTGLEGDTSFDKFSSVDELGKSYREMEKYSSGAVRIPTEDTSDEARQSFLDKVTAIDGVMRAPDGYTPPPEAPEGYSFGEVEGFTGDDSVAALKSEALKLGMTNAQADGIHQFLANGVVAQDAAATERNAEGIATLRAEWGAAFDLKAQGVENTIAMLDQKVPGLKDSDRTPEFVRLMDLIGGMLGEAGAVAQDPRIAMTRDEAREKIQEIMSNPDHPAHPSHEGERGYYEARDAVMKLQRIASAH